MIEFQLANVFSCYLLFEVHFRGDFNEIKENNPKSRKI